MIVRLVLVRHFQSPSRILTIEQRLLGLFQGRHRLLSRYRRKVLKEFPQGIASFEPREHMQVDM